MPNPSICKLVIEQLGVSPQLLNQHANEHKYEAAWNQRGCLQMERERFVVFLTSCS